MRANRFADRVDAGRRLAARLVADDLVGPAAATGRVVVVGLPRGGVPVAAEVARALAAPLDVLLVRKVGVPAQPELAMGAVGEGGTTVKNLDVIARAGVSPAVFTSVADRERAEIDRRVAAYRSGGHALDLRDRLVVIVDDGFATGATAEAAVAVARAKGASTVVVAVPVAPLDAAARIERLVERFVVVRSPEPFGAVGSFYDDFRPTSDGAVIALLAASRRPSAPGAHPDPRREDR